MGKSRIKGLTINYCCCRSQSKSQERDLLARLASHLKSRLDLGVLSCLEAYKSVLERLAALDLEAAKGAQVPSRIRWIEEGELSSAFFFRLEKKRAADRLIGSVNSTNMDCWRLFPRSILSFSLLSLAILMPNRSFFLMFCLLSPWTSLVLVRVTCLWRNVLLLSLAWPGVRPRALMACQWNSI